MSTEAVADAPPIAARAASQKTSPVCARWTDHSAGVFSSWDGLVGKYRQFALVIGNNYQAGNGALAVPVLHNPSNDAQDMSDLLAGKGYAVVCLLDLHAEDILSAFDWFSAKWIANSDGVPQGVIYFAGHGGETAAGEAFILPDDYAANSSKGVPSKLMLNSLLALLPDDDSMSAVSSVPIVIIDACRTKGETASAANSTVQNDVNSVLVPYNHVASHAPEIANLVNLVFSTSGGKPADDGPLAPGNHGTFVTVLDSELRKQPWGQITHPALSDFVQDLKSDLGQQQSEQEPNGPLSNGGPPEYVWRKPSITSEDWYVWRLGKLKGEADDKDADVCDDIDGDLPKLASLSASSQPPAWASDALKAYRDLQSSVCPAASHASAGMAEVEIATDNVAPPYDVPAMVHLYYVSATDQMETFVRIAASKHHSEMLVDPQIMSNITEGSTDVSVDLRDRHTTVRLLPMGIGSSLMISAGEFSQQDFKLDCKTNNCSKGHVFVSSPISGLSGFVPAWTLARRPTETFAAEIDGPTGAVPAYQFAKLADFLTPLNKANSRESAAEISIVEASDLGDVNDIDISGARDFMKYVRDFVAKTLSIPKEQVTILRGVQSDKEHASRCISFAIRNLCLSVEVTVPNAGGK